MPADSSEIVHRLDAARRGEETLDKAALLNWVSTSDPRVATAVIDLLLEAPTSVEPPLSWDEQGQIIREAVTKALTDESQTDVGLSPGEAADLLRLWLATSFRGQDAAAAREFETSEHLLAQLYANAGQDRRRLLREWVLFHLVEDTAMNQRLADLEKDPNLAEALEEARRWAEWIRSRRALSEAVARGAARLLSETHQGISVRVPEFGSAAVGLEWALPDGTLCSLHVDPGDGLHGPQDLSTSAQSGALDKLIDYAADQSNWKETGQLPCDWAVRLPTSPEAEDRRTS